MNKNCLIALLIASFCLTQAGCLNGAVRHNSLGYFKYAAREFPKKTESKPLKVFAVAGGTVVDSGIFVGDIVATPFVALGATSLEYKGYYIKEGDMIGGILVGLSLIIYYPKYFFKIILLQNGFGTRQEFEQIFGRGSQKFS